MDKAIVEKVKKFVEDECKKPTSRYGYDPFIFHFQPVVHYAKLLARKLIADMEIVEIAAWLHDIGSIIYGRENHHITGAKIAEEKLREFGYPEEKIKIVKQCIFSHRGSVPLKKESVEQQIIADADAMSAYSNIGGIYKAAYTYENKNQAEGNRDVLKKLTDSFNKLSPEAKKIIRPKYEAAVLLLKQF